jgi:amidohydrolase
VLHDALELAPQLIAWRRHLHRHPELSGHEEQTANLVARELRALGLEPRERIGGAWGLFADISIDGCPPALALRADMDALPITEDNDVEYASTKPGVMHACGHDAHVAMLLGAAHLLTRSARRLRQSVRIVFQPHEEKYPGGARTMIEAGALAGIRRMFGLHICTDLPFGRLGTRVGPFMAAVNPFRAVITGKGGHAAAPERCVDPIVAAAHAVVALQCVVSRAVAMSEPVVVSVTQIHAGTTDNVLPNSLHLGGTIRTYDARIRQQVCQRVRAILSDVSAAHGAAAEVEIEDGYPVLVNDRASVDLALRAARNVGFSPDDIEVLPVQGGGEDFAYFAQQVPSAFLFLGASNDAKQCVYPHHHPRFNVDEDALPRGAALLAQFALEPRDDAVPAAL